MLSAALSARTDILITASLSWPEVHFVAGFLSVAALLSLIPAIAVRRIPIVEGLRS